MSHPFARLLQSCPPSRTPSTTAVFLSADFLDLSLLLLFLLMLAAVLDDQCTTILPRPISTV